MAQDNKSPNIAVDVQTMIDESSITLSSDFEHMESVLSTLIEDAEQEPQDPPLSEELRHAIINMEDNEDVR